MANCKQVQVSGHCLIVNDGKPMQSLKGQTGRYIKRHRDGSTTVLIGGHTVHLPNSVIAEIPGRGGGERA